MHQIFLEKRIVVFLYYLMVLVKNSISTWRRKLLFKFFSLVPLAHIQGLTYTSTKTTYVLCS